MFRSQSSDHHQGSITVLVQLLLIGMHAGRSPAEIVGSNPTGGMDICLL